MNFGTNGIYYRRKISGNNNPRDTYPEEGQLTHYDEHTITSGDLDTLTDTDSQDFILELQDKAKKISYFNWFGVFPLMVAALTLFYMFFHSNTSTITIQYVENYIKSVDSIDVNVRQKPDRKSKILGVVNSKEQFKLIDESEPLWYKIDFNGTGSFVSKSNSKKSIKETPVTKKYTQPNLFSLKPNLFWVIIISYSVFFGFLLIYLKRLDNRRLLVSITYDLDETVNEIYQNFLHSFAKILESTKTWQYLHSERTNDYKYSSGAVHSVNRKPLKNISTNKMPSEIFRTNIEVPYLGLFNTELFFFPERLIIKRRNQFAAIMYKNIECSSNITRFIETGGVPNDSKVVDNTWRYLNKDGTADRRFKGNHQIPICEYSEYSFRSDSGVNEKISTSKVGAFDQFINFIKAIGDFQQTLPTLYEGTEGDRQMLN